MLTLTRWFISLIFLTGLVTALAVEIKPAPAQSAYTPLDDKQLEELLGPVALYPDDLLAIVLPASTFPLQIVQAARFRARTPDAKPDEKWDDSVVALLNYPEVLKKLNDDLDWTWRLGEAVINQQPQVLAAITGFRNRAQLAGNLKSDDKQVVEVREKIVYIRPANERVIYVPYYDPWEVTTYRTHRVYHYYPEAYPVYYYPYDYGYRFPGDTFWGVSTWYNIGWSNHHLHSLPYDYRYHPYYGRSYRNRDHRRSWRHQEHQQRGSYSGSAPEPQVVNGQPVLPDDTTWYPREGHGARPIDGRPQEIVNPIGTPPPAPLGSQIGGQVPGGGGESSVSIPEQPSINADTTGETVVYEGNVNGEQVRVIRRGTNFETQRGNNAGTIVSDAPAPVTSPVTAPASEATLDSGTMNNVTIQEAIERARQQANEQQAYSRSEPTVSGPTVEATPSWRDEAPVVRVSPEPQVEAREERRVEVYSAPAEEERPSWRQAEEVQERQSRWEDNPAVQEAISRARDYSGYGNDSPREESRESRWEAPQREERSEPAYEAPMREERSEPAYEEPAREERYEAPAGEPEIRY